MGGSEPGPAGAGSDGGAVGTPGTPPEGRRRLLVAAVAVTAVLVAVAGLVTWRVSARGPDTELAIVEPEPEPAPEVIVVEPPGRSGPRRTSSIGRGDERVVVTTTTTTTTLPPPETAPPPPPTAAPETTATTTTTLPPVPIHVIGEASLAGASVLLPAALGPGWALTVDPDPQWPSGPWDLRTARPAAQGARVVVLEACAWPGADQPALATGVVDFTTTRAFPHAERVVWVTCGPDRPGGAGVDQAIYATAHADPRVAVVQWGQVAGTAGYTFGGGRLTEQGKAELAALVAHVLGPAPA